MATSSRSSRTATARRKAPANIRRSGPLAIDVHTHIEIPAVIAFNRKHRALGEGPGRGLWVPQVTAAEHSKMARNTAKQLTTPKARLKDMNKMGVDIQILSMILPNSVFWVSGKEGAEIARQCNDGIAECVATAPDRFVGLGSVALHDVGRSVKELERAVTELGLKGVVIPSNVRAVDLGDPRFRPFWAKAEALGAPIFVHPRGFTHADRLHKYFLWNSIGQPLEEALAMASLIHEGVLDAYPKLKLGIAHGGGYLPYYCGRTDRAFRTRKEVRENIKAPPTQYMKRLYYDSIVFDRDQLAYLVRKVGAGRVMLGSDYPHEVEWDPVGFVKKTRGISTADKEKILWKNAAKLFGIRV